MESPGQLGLVHPVPDVRERCESWAKVPAVQPSSKLPPCPSPVGLASSLRTQTKLAWWGRSHTLQLNIFLAEAWMKH